MPEVGGKHFGYGSKGKKAAKKYAKKFGMKVKHKSNPGYYAESTVAGRINSVLSKLLEGRRKWAGEGAARVQQQVDAERRRKRAKPSVRKPDKTTLHPVTGKPETSAQRIEREYREAGKGGKTRR